MFEAHPCVVALLGVAYEQLTSSVKEQVARHLEMPVADVFLHRQPVSFPKLSLAGRGISVRFGVRSIATFGT